MIIQSSLIISDTINIEYLIRVGLFLNNSLIALNVVLKLNLSSFHLV